MMRQLTRTTLDLYLRTTLGPWNAVARRVGGERTSPFEVAVDRIDAAVRELVGRVTADRQLVEDAVRRRAAADNRAVASDLHDEAVRKQQEAERQREQREQQAEQARVKAAEQAEQKREAADEAAEQRRQTVRKAASGRKQAVRKAAVSKQDRIDKAQREARLRELEEKEEALNAEEQAILEDLRADRLKQSADLSRTARTANA